ncbi:Sensor histidine kinase VanS [Lachnospiraceae bacterium TWA4]|nr:Sensor histidine kinase VanS [Lachnospiraceae bacterium TWA4]
MAIAGLVILSIGPFIVRSLLNFFFGEFYYLHYRDLYFYLAFVIICILRVMAITYKLFKKATSYVYEVQSATEKLFDKDIEYIELSEELSEVELQINLVKQQSEKNEQLVKENEQRKNDLIMYLAHDLKTPLSSVIGYLNLLYDEREISEELQKKYLGISLNKAGRLEELINEFFEITRFNLSEIHLQYSKINLTILFEQLVYEFKPMLVEKNLNCNLDVGGDIDFHCDPDKIGRVFDNLLRNAILYSYEDTVIQILVTPKEQEVEICFINEGDDIPQEKLTQMFEQFYRLDVSRNTKGGTGLGLAIAKQIVELHRGTICAKSENNQIEMKVILPIS